MEVKAHAKRTKRAILHRLAESDHSSCVRLYKCIHASFPCEDPEELLGYLESIKSLQGTIVPDDEWRGSLSVFCLEVTRSLHQIVRNIVLHQLIKINFHRQYWMDSLSTSAFVRSAQFIGTQYPKVSWEVQTRIGNLRKLEKDYVEWIGNLHLSLNKMSKIRHFEDEIKPFKVYVDELYRTITSKQPNPTADPNEIVNILEESIKSLPEFKLWFAERLEPLGMPSYSRRNWLKYFIGFGSIIGVMVISGVQHNPAKKFLNKVVDSLKLVVEERVLEPTTEIWNSMFERHEELDYAKQNLDRDRMQLSQLLEDFGIPKENAKQLDLTIVNEKWDEHMKRPVLHLPALRTELYIQVEKMKVDIQGIILAVQQILKANDINLQLMGVIPIAMATLYGVKSLFSWCSNHLNYRQGHSKRRVYRRVKNKLRKMECLLIRYTDNEQKSTASDTISKDTQTKMTQRELGRLIFLLHQIRQDIPYLPHNSRTIMTEDIDILESLEYDEWQKVLHLMFMYRNHQWLQCEGF